MPVKSSITFNCLLQWIKQLKKQEKGAVAIIVALSLLVLIGFGALAVDLGYVMMVKNEVQNAADAGALAGAGDLYLNNGTAVNPAANQTAYDMATANQSQKETVFLAGPYTEDVQRGHWSFATRTFTPNDSLAPVDLWNSSTSELDADTNFINAVRVRVRTNTPVMSFLSRIWGGSSFFGRAEAVGYIGFAGTLRPRDVDQPIAICEQSIRDSDGNYTCNTGRMLNSGSNNASHNTAGWTNFVQPCRTANANELVDLSCGSGNPLPITLGATVGATGGVVDSVLTDLRECFGPTTRTEPWNMTLPVINCEGNNIDNCSTVTGAVNVSIVWISDKDADTENKFEAEGFPPSRMGDWVCPTGYTRVQCWDHFVSHFNLKNVDDLTATYAKKSIYFLPSCEPHELIGNTGGKNFGILAKIPVLVK
jgi:Flp pilus assembly protein TadG